jgi:imidazolonepropionase
MPAILGLATLGMGLGLAEAITAATLNAAAAIGRAEQIGSIEEGKRADLMVLEAPTYHHLVYHYGINPVRHVVKDGRIVVRDGTRSPGG